MDEARRFFRFVIPGALFIVLISLYTLISACEYLKANIKDIVESVKNYEILGIIFAAILTSGSIGYLFSNIFHFINNIGHRQDWKWLVVFHTPLWEEAAERKLINIVPQQTLRSDQSWSLVTAYWQSRIKNSRRTQIDGANERIKSFTDILFGLGAAIVGSIAAIPLWVCIHKALIGCYPFAIQVELIIAWIIAIMIPIIFCVNYGVVATHIERVLRSIILEVLKEEVKENSGKPIDMEIGKRSVVSQR